MCIHIYIYIYISRSLPTHLYNHPGVDRTWDFQTYFHSRDLFKLKFPYQRGYHRDTMGIKPT